MKILVTFGFFPLLVHGNIFSSRTMWQVELFVSFDEMDNHVEVVLEAHGRQAPLESGRKATGGVLPVCTDPTTRAQFFLLGYNTKSNHCCHFHGWVDVGETPAQGAARECWEESKGVVGSRVDIFRAVLDERFSLRATRSLFIMSLGELDAGGRAALVAKFAAAVAWDTHANEVNKLQFFPATVIRDKCVALGDGVGDKEKDEAAELPPVVVDEGNGAVLRSFLARWLRGPTFWSRPKLVALVEGTQSSSQLPIMPLGALPPLSVETQLQLPYRPSIYESVVAPFPGSNGDAAPSSPNRFGIKHFFEVFQRDEMLPVTCEPGVPPAWYVGRRIWYTIVMRNNRASVVDYLVDGRVASVDRRGGTLVSDALSPTCYLDFFHFYVPGCEMTFKAKLNSKAPPNGIFVVDPQRRLTGSLETFDHLSGFGTLKCLDTDHGVRHQWHSKILPFVADPGTLLRRSGRQAVSCRLSFLPVVCVLAGGAPVAAFVAFEESGRSEES